MTDTWFGLEEVQGKLILAAITMTTHTHQEVTEGTAAAVMGVVVVNKNMKHKALKENLQSIALAR